MDKVKLKERIRDKFYEVDNWGIELMVDEVMSIVDEYISGLSSTPAAEVKECNHPHASLYVNWSFQEIDCQKCGAKNI